MRSWKTLLAASVAVAVWSTAARAQVTFFEGALADASSKAKSEHKSVLVVFYAIWCGPCHELDKKVLATPEAAEATKAYVVVRVDGEKGEGPALAKKYHLVGYPTLLFLDADGEEIDRIFEVPTPEDFARAARDLPAGKGTLADAEKRFASRSSDFDLAHEIGVRHAIKGREHRAKAYFSLVEMALKGLKAAPNLPIAKEGPAAEQAKRVNDFHLASARHAEDLVAEGRYALAKYAYLRGQKNYAKARIALTDLRKQFPGSKVARVALYDLAVAQINLKDDKQARAALDQYLSESGGDASAANAYAWACFKNLFQLDRGVEVAIAALRKQPAEDGLWDTLAELYAAKGDKAKALDAAEKALALKPDDEYYRAQKEKFAVR